MERIHRQKMLQKSFNDYILTEIRLKKGLTDHLPEREGQRGIVQERRRREAKIEKPLRDELKRHHPSNKQGRETEARHPARRNRASASWYLFPLTKKLKEETKYHPLSGL